MTNSATVVDTAVIRGAGERRQWQLHFEMIAGNFVWKPHTKRTQNKSSQTLDIKLWEILICEKYGSHWMLYCPLVPQQNSQLDDILLEAVGVGAGEN